MTALDGCPVGEFLTHHGGNHKFLKTLKVPLKQDGTHHNELHKKFGDRLSLISAVTDAHNKDIMVSYQL